MQIFFIFRRRATSRVQACTDRSRWGWRATAASRGSNDSTRRSVIIRWQLAVNCDFQSLDVLDYANVKCDDGICVEEKMLGCDFPAFIKKCIFLLWMRFHKSDLINQQQEQGTNKSILRVTKNIIFCIFFSCQFHIFIVYFTVGIKVNAMDWSRQTSTNQRKTLILSRTRKHLLIIFVLVMTLLKSLTNLFLLWKLVTDFNGKHCKMWQDRYDAIAAVNK